MKIHDYATQGGKNAIKSYIYRLSEIEQSEIFNIRKNIRRDGLSALDKEKTRQLRGKLWEIKVSQNRIMYVVKDGDNIFFLHICKKQKDKAEKFELEKAIKRAKEINLL